MTIMYMYITLSMYIYCMYMYVYTTAHVQYVLGYTINPPTMSLYFDHNVQFTCPCISWYMIVHVCPIQCHCITVIYSVDTCVHQGQQGRAQARGRSE